MAVTRAQSQSKSQSQTQAQSQSSKAAAAATPPQSEIRMTITPMLTPKKSKYQLDSIAKKEQEKKARLEQQRIYREKWVAERKVVFEQYRDSPICRFIRKMKLTESAETVNSVLFYLGEIKGPQCSLNWALGHLDKTSRHNLIVTIRALKVACPRISIKVTTDFENYWCPGGSTDSELNISWNEGDMSDAVLNDHIFPDYACVDKLSLEY